MSYLFSKNTEIEKKYRESLTPISEHVKIFKNLNKLENLGFSDDDILRFESKLKALGDSITPIGVGIWLNGDFKMSWSAAIRCLERMLGEIGFKLHNVFDVNDERLEVSSCDVHRNESIIDIVGLKTKLTPEWAGKNVDMSYPTMSVLWWLIFNVHIFEKMCRDSKDTIATGIVFPSIVINGMYMPHICCYQKIVCVNLVPIDDRKKNVIVHSFCEIRRPYCVDKPVCR